MARTLQRRLIGMRFGNFHPTQQPREEFLVKVEEAKAVHLPRSFSWIFAPAVGFTTRIVEPHEDNDIWAPGFLRTKHPTDGGLIINAGPEMAIAIFNGDCPILCLKQEERLSLLHLGYRCLMRTNPEEEGIVEVGIRHFDPTRVEAFIFGGIGPCCWLPEYDDKPEILNPKRSRHPELLARCLGRTTRSPAGPGHVSVDLYALARELLLHVGVPVKNMSWDTTCTCCAMERGEPLYWSHTRHKAKQQEVDGRNFAVVWLER